MADSPEKWSQNVKFEDGKGFKRNGSPFFYELLERMASIHDKKSHDYASNSDPFGNYHFSGRLGKLFNNPDDSGFVTRIGEKLYRLANLENDGKIPENEAIEDTEVDLCVIIVLWMADRIDRRVRKLKAKGERELAYHLDEERFLRKEDSD